MRPLSFTKTQKGKDTTKNNDLVYTDDSLGIYMLADGMGPDLDGAMASTMIVESFKNFITNQRETVVRLFNEKDYQQISLLLKNEMYQTSVQLYTTSMEEKKDLRVQFVCLLQHNMDGLIFFCGNVGINLIREQKVYPLITDENRDTVGILGSPSSPQVGSMKVDLFPNDVLVLFSDGLMDIINSRQDVLSDIAYNPRRSLDALFSTPSKDNATCLVLQFPSLSGKEDRIAKRKHREYSVVQSIPIFKSLTMSELNVVMSIVTEAKFKDGETLVKEGDKSNGLFVIVSGECEIIVGNKKVATVKQGTYIGEVSWIDGAPRSATVRAKGDVEVLFFERKGLLKAMSKNPGLAVKILGTIAQILAKRLRVTNAKLNKLIDKYKEVKSALKEYEDLEIVEVVKPE